MDQYELIRTAARVYQKSIRQIARETGHTRKTIRKVLAGWEPKYRRRHDPASRVMDSIAAIIEGWLRADQETPKKQRHTRDPGRVPGTRAEPAAQRRAHRQDTYHCFLSVPGPGDGIGVKACEAYNYCRTEAYVVQIGRDQPRPHLTRRIEACESGPVNPKDAGLLGGWLDLRRKAAELFRDRLDRFIDLSRGDHADPQVSRRRSKGRDARQPHAPSH